MAKSRVRGKDQKANLARAIINNPVWPEIFEDMQQGYFTQFVANTDKENRERIALAIDMMGDFRDQLEAYIVNDTDINQVGDNENVSE